MNQSIKTPRTRRQKMMWNAYVRGVPLLSRGYRAVSPRLRARVAARAVSGYDPDVYGFRGGELEGLTKTNYEKSLRNLWKAEIQAPYLGIRDATKLEKAGQPFVEELDETEKLVQVATSDAVRAEFEAAFTPAQRDAIGWLMSLIGHGEAYALFTSSNLVQVVRGTGARVGMAMQVVEEAKHFIVLRAMLKTLGIARPIHDSAYVLFEGIAAAPPYRKLFGMNVILESFATSIFAQFAEYPGLKHIVHVFHMDEARHCGFPKSYNASGNLPQWVTESKREAWKRLALIAPAIPLIFDYKPYFETLGLDCFSFFGKFFAKATRLAWDSGFPLPGSRDRALAQMNLAFNSYVAAFEPHKFNGYRDYTALHEGDVRPDLLERELDVFGRDVFVTAV